jgi:glycerate dehydrogenase
MKIVFLDADTLGNDLNFSGLQSEGSLDIYPITPREKLAERLAGADIVITNKVPLSAAEMDMAPNLKLICVAATGYNIINVAEATKRNIPVANVKAYSTEAVVQLTFALILAVENALPQFITDVKDGSWQKSPIFTLLTYPIFELAGKTLGCIGYGNIGKRVAEVASAFGMNILVGNLQRKEDKKNERVPLDYLLKNSDIISIHCPLTEKTRNLIGAKELAMMKKSAILVNTARGGIVNEDDLYEALANKTIRAAAFDVLSTEPPVDGNKLIGLPNMIVTPHIAWTSVESRQRLLNGLVSNIREFKAGNAKKIRVN